MTSRDPGGRRAWDQLDLTIRATLRESVADSVPPAHAWGRIKSQLAVDDNDHWAAWERRLRRGAEVFLLAVLGSMGVARSEMPCGGLAACDPWQGECLSWADQYGILLRRLAVL